VLLAAWPGASLAQIQTAQSIGLFEGNYGSFLNANNWGNIQCRGTAPCPPDCAEARDTHADGSSYRACFRIYPSQEAGAAALVSQLGKSITRGIEKATGDLRTRIGSADAAGVLASGNADLVAESMRAGGYFEATASHYAKAIALNAAGIAQSLGEPLAVFRAADMPPGAPGLPPGGVPGQDGGDDLGAVLGAALLAAVFFL
jgi:hypothetical protein